MPSKILVVFILSCLTIGVVSQCNKPDKLIGQKCYQFNNKFVSLSDASNHCSSQGYHLMSVHSRDESEAVGKIARHSFAKFEVEYWIGLRKTASGFIWDDASPVDYLFWAPENVFMFDYVSVFVHNDQWHSSPEHTWFPFVCSYNAKLVTTTTNTFRTTTSSTIRPETVPPSTTVKSQITSTTTVLRTTKTTTISTSTLPATTSTLSTTRRSTITTTSATFPLNSCQSGDITLQDRCFSFNRQKLTRENARIECARIGKTLAILDNISQSTFLSSYAQNQFDTSFASFWIGLQRKNSSTPFHWQDQAPMMFTNWASGYPFDGELYAAQDISNTKWRTYSPDTLLFSVCSRKV